MSPLRQQMIEAIVAAREWRGARSRPTCRPSRSWRATITAALIAPMPRRSRRGCRTGSPCGHLAYIMVRTPGSGRLVT